MSSKEIPINIKYRDRMRADLRQDHIYRNNNHENWRSSLLASRRCRRLLGGYGLE